MNWENWHAHPDDRRFVDQILQRSPREFVPHIRKKYNRLSTDNSRRDANMFLLEYEDTLKTAQFNLASSDEDIRDKARKEALTCKKITAGFKKKEQAIPALSSYSGIFGINPPNANTEIGIVNRYCSERWWRRQLRAHHGQKIEEIALNLNIVNKKNQIYASDAAVNRRKGQKIRNRNILEELEAVNELGDSFTLQELADKSVSNPKLKRAELMTRIAGTELIAKDMGHAGEFYTLTCPSRMHSSLSKSGAPNPKYDGTTPKEAQQYLARIWSHIRTELSNKNIPIYGIRVAEPHHDGTPHWHFLLFMAPENKHTVRQIFRKHALKVDGDEQGAKKYRFKAIAIDSKKGTAAGYVAKYVSKNIDGHGLDADTYGTNAVTASERIEAHVSTWNIRQFQFFGNPSVTIWRELRRSSIDTSNEVIKKAAHAADSGDWAEFVRIMGGVLIPRKFRPIRITRAWSDRPGRYDEPIGYQITGIETGSGSVRTRLHVWTIEHKPPQKSIFRRISEKFGNTFQKTSEDSHIFKQNQCIRQCTQFPENYEIFGTEIPHDSRNFQESSGFSPPWSSVNNCTFPNMDTGKPTGNRAEIPNFPPDSGS